MPARIVLVLIAALACASAAAGSDPKHPPAIARCQKARTCPASAHQYAWKGLVCADAKHATKGVDTKRITWQGARRYCHAASTSGASAYSWHTHIVSTTFWVGEIFNGSIADGSQVCSTYDSQWAYHYSGVNNGPAPKGTDCSGAPVGGCDGIASAGSCRTEPRSAANGYFPTRMTPRENPFYLDLPFDDVNDRTAFAERCQVIPWASQPGFAGHCNDGGFSYMKNHWVRLVGPNGKTCYGQVEDAGPSHGNLYHDAAYVFGAQNAQPIQGQFNDAGLDVSPALNGCLGFAELDGDGDRVSWQFVDASDVPAGPWLRVVTTTQVS
ncbi:MAG: hypothetical protein ACXVRZ_04100 [Gaiellaceae bacterium]